MADRWRLAIVRNRDGSHTHLSVLWDSVAAGQIVAQALEKLPEGCQKCELWRPELEILMMHPVTDF